MKSVNRKAPAKNNLTKKHPKKKNRQHAVLYSATAAMVVLAVFSVFLFVIFLRERAGSQVPASLLSMPGAEKNGDWTNAPEEEQNVLAPTEKQTGEVPEKKENAIALEDKKIKPKGKISIVIDDCGHNTYELEPFLSLPFKLAFAILPGLAYTEDTAKMAVSAGKDIILHQPMEAIGNEDPGPKAIYVSMSDIEIYRTLSDNLASLPGAKGINNHMGSKVTSDRKSMISVMNALKNRGLFFLDSLTTAESFAEETARDTGIPYLRRSTFLDNIKDRQAIVESAVSGLQTAESRGHAILIGHVWTDTLADVLTEMYPEIIGSGFEIVSLTDILKEWK